MSATERLAAALADRYRIERQVGQGGMATVYLAADVRHDRKVAIKVLRPELSAVLGADRFVQEIKTTAALQHPHILPLFDSGSIDGLLFYVMPFIEGETLRDRLNREHQLGIDEAVKITTEIADALDYAHRHGVIHRDIKPENILLHDGRPMVADFGIALAVSAAAGGRMTETGLSLGTPHYMSPEQATAEKEITGRSDIYSLASVLYEMLSGNPPHMGSSAQQIIMKIITEQAAPVTSVRKAVPANVTAALTKALEKLPADRFESAKEFADALANPHFGDSQSTGVAALVPHRSRRVVAIGAAAAGLVIGVAGSWLALRNTPSDQGVTFTQQTFGREPIYAARWGADGKTILYTSMSDASVAGMQILRSDYPEPVPFGPDSAHLLAVSSKNEVALLTHAQYLNQRIFRGTLAVMSVGGGSPREITENVQEADWSPDGSQLAITRRFADHDELEFPIGKKILSGPQNGYISDIRVAPDGHHIAMFLHPFRYDDRGFVQIVDLAGVVTKGSQEFAGLEGLAWSADGKDVLFSGSVDGGQFDIRRWRPGRKMDLAKVLPNAGRLTIYDARAGSWLVTRDETPWLVVARAPGAAGVRNLGWLDQSVQPVMSGDGRMVAFSDQTLLGGSLYGLMVRKAEGSPAVRIGDGLPIQFSPDNRWVMASVATSPPQLRVYPTGPGSARTLSWPKLAAVFYAMFYPDGTGLLVCGREANRPARCYRSSLEGGDVTPVTPDSVTGGVRPDGSVGARDADGRVWIYPPGGGPRRGGVNPGARILRSSPNGNEVWVLRNGAPGHRGVDRVDVVTGRRTPLIDLEELPGVTAPSIGSVSLADDGRSYAYNLFLYSSLLFTVTGVR